MSDGGFKELGAQVLTFVLLWLWAEQCWVLCEAPSLHCSGFVSL